MGGAYVWVDGLVDVYVQIHRCERKLHRMIDYTIQIALIRLAYMGWLAILLKLELCKKRLVLQIILVLSGQCMLPMMEKREKVN